MTPFRSLPRRVTDPAYNRCSRARWARMRFHSVNSVANYFDFDYTVNLVVNSACPVHDNARGATGPFNLEPEVPPRIHGAPRAITQIRET
jgi:hypothetical protein